MTITIPGPLRSYHEIRSTGRRGKGGPQWARPSEYKAYQQAIRLLANVARIPDDIPSNSYARCQVEIWWTKRARLDISNVWKAIEDGLFGQDRRVQEVHLKMRENTGRPERADVTVHIFRIPKLQEAR